MADMEKVMQGLEHCRLMCEGVSHNPCQGCLYHGKYDCADTLKTDTLALLKELDTVEHACDILRANGWKETEPLCSECDAVHVVRCMDCIWWHQSETNEAYGDCGQANGIALKPFDWFCADGERRTDDA